MNLIALLVLLLPVQQVSSQKVSYPAYYPPATYQMSPEEFYDWAVAFNKQQKEEWETRREPDLEGLEIVDRRDSTVFLPRRWPSTHGTGPLTIINPFCPPR
jgi:hypothetical protein